MNVKRPVLQHRDRIGLFMMAKTGPRAFCIGLAVSLSLTVQGATLTALKLGDAISEARHNVTAHHAGAISVSERPLDTPGRRIVPAAGQGPGWIAFDAAVSPTEKTYITLKIWGSDQTWGPLHLLRDEDGLELGDIWWFNTREKPFPDRWIYRTYWIPRDVTQGRSRIRLRLQNVPVPEVIGAFRNIDQEPPPLAYRPTFAVYGVYTHTDPFFEIPAEERQGAPFVWGPRRKKPQGYPAVEERLLERARNDIDAVMRSNVMKSDYGTGHRRTLRDLAALGLIYHTEWSGHYHDESIPPRMRDAIDLNVKRQARQGGDPGTMFYRGWDGHGYIGLAYGRMHDDFENRGWLDDDITLEYPGGARTMSRRQAYADFFHDAFVWRRQDRRHYTNQPLYISRAMYRMQNALRKLDPKRALTEPQALWYIHEALGIVPLRSREFGIFGDMAGFPFFTVTNKGLCRELGYVDAYGELTGSMLWVVRETGCPLVKQQAIKAMRARSIFRIPVNDDDGFRALRSIGFMSWRGPRHPFEIRYDGLFEAAVLEDPVALRLAELEIEHGRYYLYRPVPERGPHWEPENTMREYEYYLKVKEMPPSPHRLPMEPEHGDFVWSDEEVGVYVFRHGEVQVYGTFWHHYATSGAAIGDIAPLRYTTPLTERLADVRVEAFAPTTGMFLEVEFPFGRRKFEQTPLPPGVQAWPELPPNAIDRRQGLAYFYRLHYGDYLIGMNTTQNDTYRESTYTLTPPDGVSSAVDVHTGETVDLTQPLRIGPASTVVLYLGKEAR